MRFDRLFRTVVRPRVSTAGSWMILFSLLGLSYLASYVLGGSEAFEPMWVLFAIAYAAWRLGGWATAVAVGTSVFLVGPLLPADVALGIPQQFEDWGSRAFFLVFVGTLLAYLFGQYRRTVTLVELERDAAISQARVQLRGAELQQAMDLGQLFLNYQPIVRAGDAEIVAVEALVRWKHPVRGLVSPAEFIPLAEESGAITRLDAWVAGMAAREVLTWQGLQPVRLGLNLSSVTLSDPAAMVAVERALVDSALDLSLVDIEMTETAAADGSAVNASLQRLVELGARLALDDFGMGYAVLERLRAFPFRTLKVDRSFVSRVTGEDGPMVDAIVRMAHSMGLEVLAEGVEEFDQLEALRALGCDLIQGFLISKPVAASELRRLLVARAGLAGTTADSVHPVLEQVIRLTGLSNAYLTRIDWAAEAQEVTAAVHHGQQLVSEGLRVAWADSLCRRALEGGPRLTADAANDYPDSSAAAMGIQSYVTVPLRRDGEVVGTLCGISSERVNLPPETLRILAGLAESIVAERPVAAALPRLEAQAAAF